MAGSALKSQAVVSEAGRQCLRLQLTKNVGPIRFGRLLGHFGSVEEILSASEAELERVEGIGPHVAWQIRNALAGEAVEDEIQKAADCGVRIVSRLDPEYPAALRQAPDGPICLYTQGKLGVEDAMAVAIVGTRRCSHYGLEQAHRFAVALAGAGYTVVSGLARGVDGHAHRGAMSAGGRTIAVLGNGLPEIYPAEHTALAAEIQNAGAVVTELPINCDPDAKNFPRRNRIIAGLSLGVIVIEAGPTSGALITALVAQEYGREVFALPGRVDQPEFTLGVNGLIRSGKAKLVMDIEHVLDALRSRHGTNSPPPRGAGIANGSEAPESAVRLAAMEQSVFDAIVQGVHDADAICDATRLDMGSVISVLTSLELKALIRRLPGSRYERRHAAR